MIKMKNITKVEYKVRGNGVVEVTRINRMKCEDVFYFDTDDFVSNIVDLVELITGTTDFIIKRVLA